MQCNGRAATMPAVKRTSASAVRHVGVGGGDSAAEWPCGLVSAVGADWPARRGGRGQAPATHARTHARGPATRPVA